MRKLLCHVLFLFSLNVAGHPGIGLVYDGLETIYFSDLQHIWRLSITTGEKELLLENIHSHELAIDSVGALYGEHYWYNETQQVFKHYVWKLKQDQLLQKIRADQVGENDHFSFVRNKLFEGFRLEHVNGQYQIKKGNQTKEKVVFQGQFNHPTWMSVSSQDDLLIADYPLLLRITEGICDTIAHDLSRSSVPFSFQRDDHHIYGSWRGPDQKIYVAIYGDRSILKVDPETKKTEKVYTSGFWKSPVNGLFDRNGELWVLESTMMGSVSLKKVASKELDKSSNYLPAVIISLLVVFLLWFRRINLRKRIAIE